MSSNKLKRAVLVRLTVRDNKMFVSLDDVEELHPQSKEWRQREMFTFQEIDEHNFDRMEFEKQDLADFGFYILARLHAFRSMGEGP